MRRVEQQRVILNTAIECKVALTEVLNNYGKSLTPEKLRHLQSAIDELDNLTIIVKPGQVWKHEDGVTYKVQEVDKGFVHIFGPCLWPMDKFLKEFTNVDHLALPVRENTAKGKAKGKATRHHL
jgi:hypothetical protein